MPREEGDLIFRLLADKCLNERLNKERDTSRKLKCKKYEKEFSEIKVCLFATVTLSYNAIYVAVFIGVLHTSSGRRQGRCFLAHLFP